MKIDKQLISELENLTRLELSETEREKIAADLTQILDMVEKLNEVDTEGVEPLVYVSGETNVLRPDEVKDQLDRKTALRDAPMSDGVYFMVPKVIQQKK